MLRWCYTSPCILSRLFLLFKSFNLRSLLDERSFRGRNFLPLLFFRESLHTQETEKAGMIMGEVRVRVKLTNAIDEGMVRRGLMSPDDVRVYEPDALVDTGAVRCVLPSFLVERLGLARVARAVAQYADGRLDEVDLTEGFVLEIMGRRTIEEGLVLGDEVLIGQTALEKLDLLPDCQNQRLIPNPAHPDQPISKVK